MQHPTPPPSYTNVGCSCYLNVAMQLLASVGGSTFKTMHELFQSGGPKNGRLVVEMYNALMKKYGGNPHTRQMGDDYEALVNMMGATEELGFKDFMHKTKWTTSRLFVCTQSPTHHMACPMKSDSCNSIQLRVKDMSQTASVTELLMNCFGGKSHDSEPIKELHCEGCETKGDGFVEHNIKTLPDVLILHITRASDCVGGRSSLEVKVSLSFRINLVVRHLNKKSQFESNPISYELQSVSLHHGASATGGHFTALRHYSKVWWHIDDSSVSVVRDIEECLSRFGRNVTTLVYHRKHATAGP
jgi:ubiquitin C-terminal hydrolase